MRVRGRVRSVLATLAILGSSACQAAAPAVPTMVQPAAPTATPQPRPTTAPLPLPTSVPAVATAVSPAATAKPAPTTLPTLPTSVLGSLGAEQAQAVRDGHAALAGGDYPRAIALLEPLLNQLSGEPQAEVRLIYGQALVGDRQFDNALASSDTLLASTQTRADLNSAARLLKGQALRGLERWEDAAVEMRGVADSNPLVAAAVRLELEDM